MKVIDVSPKPELKGIDLSFPGDKSLSHRAIIFGSLAQGTSHFSNVLYGEDCLCTRKAFEDMGVTIKSLSPSEIQIEGKGLFSLTKPKGKLYLGNSGTSMRLLLGLLSGQNFSSTLTGDPSLSSRPMRRVTDYLKQMGAQIEGANQANFAPLTVIGSSLKGIEANLPISSAQVKSAILLAGLYAKGATSVTEPEKSRDHTERFLKYFGAKVTEKGLSVSIESGQTLDARSFEIAGDVSSAAFFMVIACLFPKQRFHFKRVLWNPTRTGIVDVLMRMGVEFVIERLDEKGPEPVADFFMKVTSLKPFQIQKEELPRLIDEIPILCVLATQASGESWIHDAHELRVKETDRIASMSKMLRRLGADVVVEKDSMLIVGPTKLRGAVVDSFKDHRTAMSLIVAGLIASGKTCVQDIECIQTSFPNFFELLQKIQADFVISEQID